MTITGRCLCGAVTYQCNAEPVLQFNCHCQDCQKSSGSAYAPIMFFPKASVVIEGTVTYYESLGKSGKPIRRGFCPACGSQLFGNPEILADFISIRVGTLDDTSIYQPRAEIFTAHAPAWSLLQEETKKFPYAAPARNA